MTYSTIAVRQDFAVDIDINNDIIPSYEKH